MSENNVNEQGNKGRSITDGLPVRYELIDKDGRAHGPMAGFETAASAIAAAVLMWPDQEQDEDRTGKGWDVQVCQP